MASRKKKTHDQSEISVKPKRDYSYLLPYQFKPGKSGNPGGRTPGIVSLPTKIKQIADEAVDENGQTRLSVLLRTMFQEAIEGDKETRQVLFDQGWGTLIYKQANIDASAMLIEAAKSSNVSPELIRSDPILFAIFTAIGVTPDSILPNQSTEEGSVIIDNKPTQT